MNRVTFVSSSDHKYFPMLLEWIHSIRRFPQSQSMDICILDAGMRPDQLERLAPLVSKIVPGEWPCAIPKYKIREREYMKACVCRPFLPDFFPGYDTYFWMDADTWVQNWESVELFLKGAARNKIALTGQSDRSYPKGMRVKWLGTMPWKVRGFYFTNARKAFSMGMARDLFPYHVLLAGAFCMHKDAPHWKRWQELIVQALQKGKVFTAEQLTLGILVHLEGFPAEILPAWCHWLCEFKPLYDTETHSFVEPFLPHKRIGILHLSGYDKMRIDRGETTDFQTLDGQTRTLSYRYPLYDGEARRALNPAVSEERVFAKAS